MSNLINEPDEDGFTPVLETQFLLELGTGLDQVVPHQPQIPLHHLALSSGNGYPLSPQEVEVFNNPDLHQRLYDDAMKRSEVPRDDIVQYHDRRKRRRTGPKSSITSPALSRSARSVYESSPGLSSPGEAQIRMTSSLLHNNTHVCNSNLTSFPASQQSSTSQPNTTSSIQNDKLIEDRTHLRSRSSRKDQIYPCPNCDDAKFFKTKNDLDRHRKTLHNILVKGDKIYRCQIANCGSIGKIWPRYDNFKQHVTRMHGADYESAIEDMLEYYDEAVHGRLEGNKNRNRTKSNPGQSTTADESNANAALDHDLLPNHHNEDANISSSRSSVHQAFGSRQSQVQFAPAPNFFSPIQWRHGPPHVVSPNAFQQQVDRYTVANPETVWRQQREMQEQNRQSVNLQAPTPSAGDLGFMGEVVDSTNPRLGHPSSHFASHEENSYLARAIDLDAVQPQEATELNAIIRRIEGLPREQQQHVRSRLGLPQNKSLRGQVRSAKSAKQGHEPKTDCEKESKTLKCRRGNCSKMFNKCSDLHKHERRHDKNYGCTFDDCFKRFGTKWEWKRHESGQHVQLEEWRCEFTPGTKRKCATHFDDRSKLSDHLRSHGLDEHDICARIKKYCLAKRWLGSYWCGFCDTIVESHAAYGIDMNNERYNHIANHLDESKSDKIKLEMDQWIELKKGGRTKGELYEEYQKEKSKKQNDVEQHSKPIATASPSSTTTRDRSVRRNERHMQDESKSLSVDTKMHKPVEDPHEFVSLARRHSMLSPVPRIEISPAEGEHSMGMVDGGQLLEQHPQSIQAQSFYEQGNMADMPDLYFEHACCHCLTRLHQHGTAACSNCGHMFCQSCRFEQDSEQQWLPNSFR